jgi:hypothetical protein
MRSGRAQRTTSTVDVMSENSHLTVTIVMPCLNEAASVSTCVQDAREALISSGLSGEVLVVDNGSTDGSELEASRAGARVVTERSPGYGSALARGFAEASGEIIVMLDADLTYPVERVGDLLAPLLQGEAEIVYGGRLHEATRATMPWLHRHVGTPALTFLMKRACGGISLRDSQSGFRAFRRSTILAMDLRSPGMEINAEMLIKASQAGLRIVEVPTGYRPRAGESKLRTFSDGWRNLRTIFLLVPEMLLIWPGAAVLAVGLAMTVAGFLSPKGIALGSLRWQPVFFASIALTLGVLSLLAGAILAHTSPVVTNSVRRRYTFIGDVRFLSRCIIGGFAAATIGLAIDVGLLTNWAVQRDASTRGLALASASLGESLIITGVVVAMFGVVARLFMERRAAQVVVLAMPRLSVHDTVVAREPDTLP